MHSRGIDGCMFSLESFDLDEQGQLLNMIVIVVVLTTIISITIFNNQTTTGSSDDSRSILPNYREGYEVGKVQGREDHLTMCNI